VSTPNRTPSRLLPVLLSLPCTGVIASIQVLVSTLLINALQVEFPHQAIDFAWSGQSAQIPLSAVLGVVAGAAAQIPVLLIIQLAAFGRDVREWLDNLWTAAYPVAGAVCLLVANDNDSWGKGVTAGGLLLVIAGLTQLFTRFCNHLYPAELTTPPQDETE
jgi:hypothetical protein